ncbi:hypothetical protein DM860_018283 [Cuscuta australis]|uniref:Uncharacterized protein n=1 Tax=Cuscuta australis TaxID=267555 RepID=A0A328EEL9_9ASTE|nr:hypothetical protein DM860_018283 [Cuscuta australis]
MPEAAICSPSPPRVFKSSLEKVHLRFNQNLARVVESDDDAVGDGDDDGDSDDVGNGDSDDVGDGDGDGVGQMNPMGEEKRRESI